MSAKNTGTRINTCIANVFMPPTMVAKMGSITSAPTPVSRILALEPWLEELLSLADGHNDSTASIRAQENSTTFH
jgi:hypothetical protein